MQSLQKNRMPCLKMSALTCVLATLMMLFILAGCTAANRKAGSGMGDGRYHVSEEFVIEPLQGGREGFIIRENSPLDETFRSDFDRAVGLLENKEYERAADLLEKIIERSPGVSAPYINMAIACRQLGKLELAEEYLKTALSLVPEHPAACNEYGLLFRQTGKFNQARAMYEKAIDRFPHYYPIHKNLGILCDLYLNDQTCALEHYEIYSRAIPQDKQVELWIADLRIRLGKN